MCVNPLKLSCNFLLRFATKFETMQIGFVTTVEKPDMMPYDLKARKILMEKQVNVEILSWEDFDEENVNKLADFDLIVIRTTWNYYKQIPAFKKFLDLVEKSGVKVYNPVKLIKWNMDKKYLQELQSDGFDIIPTIFVFNGEEDTFEQAVAKGWKQIVKLLPVKFLLCILPMATDIL